MEKYLPGITSKVEGVLTAIGEVGNIAGFIFGAKLLADGIKDNNASEIISGSLTIGATLAPEIATQMAARIASESIASTFGMFVGVAIADALAIKQGIENEILFNQLKNQDRDLEQAFNSNANLMLKAAGHMKGLIQGSAIEELYFLVNNAGNILYEVNKETVDTLVNRLTVAGLLARAQNLSKSYTAPIKLTPSHSKSDVKQTLEFLRNQLIYRYSLFTMAMFSPDTKVRVNRQYSDMSLLPSDQEISASHNHLAPLLTWYDSVLFPAISAILPDFFSSQTLVNELQEILTNNEVMLNIQKSMIQEFNDVISKRLAWYVFGAEVLNNIDYTALEIERVAIWFLNLTKNGQLQFVPGVGAILGNPIVEFFVENALVQDEIKKLGVAPAISRLVEHLISAQVDITKPLASNTIFAQVMNDPQFQDLNYLISGAYAKAASKVKGLILSEKDVNPIHLSLNQQQGLQKVLDELSNKGFFKEQFKKALAENVKPFYTPNRDALRNIFQGASAISWDYNRRIISFIDAALEKLDKGFSATSVLTGLRSAIGLEYNKFSQGNNNGIISADYVKGQFWAFNALRFEVLPYIWQEHQEIQKYVSASVLNFSKDN